MNRHMIFRWVFGTATVTVIAFIVVGCVTVIAAGPPHGIAWQIERRQRDLLYHTDHAGLLTACRQFMGDQPLPKFGMSFSGTDPRLPTVIRDLHANRIYASNDYMSIDFGGGFIDGYGFTAYAPRSDLEKQDGGNPAASGALVQRRAKRNALTLKANLLYTSLTRWAVAFTSTLMPTDLQRGSSRCEREARAGESAIRIG